MKFEKGGPRPAGEEEEEDGGGEDELKLCKPQNTLNTRKRNEPLN